MDADRPDLDLTGWNLGHAADVEWVPWGTGGLARAKVLATGDGFVVALVEASAGYAGDPHAHAHTEFLHVVAGSLRTQGTTLEVGDSYVAEAGSVHQDFEVPAGATYLSIFKI